MFFLDSFRLRLFFKLIEFFFFIICVNLVKIVGFFNFVLSEKKQNDPVIFFYLGLDSESMAIKAVHFEDFKKGIDDEWIVGWQDELDMSRVT
jgi:hypothetical protein